MSQEKYFRTTGGDDYFERNAKGQETPARNRAGFELIKALPPGALPANGRAAVFGGSGGREAAGLSELLRGWKLTNVDISPKAIEFGKSVFPKVHHHCLSITSKTPDVATVIGEQDLIFAVGVLLWLDRQYLARAIANMDECLLDGGFLLIADFLPSGPRKNPIRHSPEHYTYKQDYSAPFLSLGTYELIAMPTSVGSHPENISADERRTGYHLLSLGNFCSNGDC